MGDSIPEGWLKSDLAKSVSLVYGKSPKEISDDSGTFPIIGTGGIVAVSYTHLTLPTILLV